jgi:hypothetical protein
MTSNIAEQTSQKLTAAEWRALLDEDAGAIYDYFDTLSRQNAVSLQYVEGLLVLFPLVMPTDHHKQWIRILADIFAIVQTEASDSMIQEADHSELTKAINKGLKRARKHIPLELVFDIYADLFAYYLSRGGEHNVEVVLACYHHANLINQQATYIRMYTQLAQAYLQWTMPDKARDVALLAWQLSQKPRHSKEVLPLVISAYQQLGETETASWYEQLISS